jgi:mRNA interferase RelE/StbE
MSYELYITSHARRKLKKLPVDVSKKIRSKIDALCKNPFSENLDTKKLVNSSCYRLRVGDYRVIYNIFESTLVIELVDLGHRREIYA